MRNTIRRIFAPSLAIAVLMVAGASPALAHERRSVGPFTFVVGFVVEPAVVNSPNGVDLRIADAQTNAPVTGAEANLWVMITPSYGPYIRAIRARGTAPGAYTADITPGNVGRYSFRILGSINGIPVDQTFTSGPGTFGDVVPVTTAPPTPSPAPLVPEAPPTGLTSLFGNLQVWFGLR